MSDIIKKEKQEVAVKELNLDIVNGNIPSDFYSNSPCLIGYAYIRFEVNGSIVPCCIAKHSIGNVLEQDWREIWHSGAYDNFRRKMIRIHTDKFHLKDPEWTFCQQCSHLDQNQRKNDLLKIPRGQD